MEFIEGVDALISMLSTKNNIYAKESEHYPPVFTIANFARMNEKTFSNLPLEERQEKVLDLLRDKYLNNYECVGDKRFSIRSINTLGLYRITIFIIYTSIMKWIVWQLSKPYDAYSIWYQSSILRSQERLFSL